MEKYIKELFEAMNLQLKNLEKEVIDPLEQAREAIEIIRPILQQLRDIFLRYDGIDRQEEIRFFKKIKPKFASRLIYYLRVFHIESRCPTASKSLIEELLVGELKRIKYFFRQNLEFYQYYITGAEYLDEWLFIRGRYDLHLVTDEYFMLIDPDFSTVHSYKVSRMLAYNALKEYLNNRLLLLANGQRAKVGKRTLRWTASKADLIELLYALQSAGVFNNSKSDVKMVAKFLESIFHIKLGNYYRVFQEIRIRKKSRTRFLDLLKDTLIKRMDETDTQGIGGST